jgi:hypothetical protein
MNVKKIFLIGIFFAWVLVQCNIAIGNGTNPFCNTIHSFILLAAKSNKSLKDVITEKPELFLASATAARNAVYSKVKEDTVVVAKNAIMLGGKKVVSSNAVFSQAVTVATKHASKGIFSTIIDGIANKWIGETAFCIGNDLLNDYFSYKAAKELKNAKIALLKAIRKNEKNKLGLYALPEGCEKEAAALIALPNGNQEIQNIRKYFNFCSDKNSPSRG